MVNSVSVQTAEFLSSALLGVYLGVLFDVIRTVRAYLPRNRTLTALFDILFWLIAVISLLAFVMTASGGKMRWYVLVGAFCGGFVYMAALSGIVYKIFLSLVSALRKALNLITRPLYLILRWIWKKIKRAEAGAEARIRAGVRKRRMKKRKAVINGSEKTKKKSKPVS